MYVLPSDTDWRKGQVTEQGKDPSRYRIPGTDLESIDIIFALGYGDGFCIGNALKYIVRASNEPPIPKKIKKKKKKLKKWIRDQAKAQRVDLGKAHHYLSMSLSHPGVTEEHHNG